MKFQAKQEIRMQADHHVLYYSVLRGCSTPRIRQDKGSSSKEAGQKGDKPILVTKEWLNAQQMNGEVPVCFHWYRLGHCAYGPLCKFRHPPEMAGHEQKEKGLTIEELQRDEQNTEANNSYDVQTIAAERRKLFAK